MTSFILMSFFSELTSVSLLEKSTRNETLKIMRPSNTTDCNGLLVWKMKPSSYSWRKMTNYAVLSGVSLICRFGSLTVWYLQDSSSITRKHLCIMENEDVVSFVITEAILVVHFKAQPSHLKNLQATHFQSRKGNKTLLQ